MPRRSPSEIVEIIKLLTEGKGTVRIDKTQNQLIVITNKQKHKEIAKLIHSINAPTPNVQIEVQFNSTTDASTVDLGAEGSGSVIISPNKLTHQYKIKPRVKHQSSTSDIMTKQTILVSSGREATLLVGAEVPLVIAEWLIQYGHTWGYIDKEIVWREVGSKLWVCPTVIGDGPYISIKLIPEISSIVNGKRQTVKITRVSTEIIAMNGRPITFGGAGKNEEFYRRFLAGLSKTSKSSQTQITLIPRIIKPAGK
ncbi:hypothetical protein ACFLS1_00740 [Verrucomicrobiota bacterium]